MQNELLGRLMHLEEQYPSAAKVVGLGERIDSFGAKIGRSRSAWQPRYPGPLEGELQADAPGLLLTPEMVEMIRESTVGKVGAERCIGISVVSPIWAVSDELISEMTGELERSPIPVDEKGRWAFQFVLGGLAHLAGLKRSQKLANVVASLSLRSVTSRTMPLRYAEVLPSAIEASAAFTALDQRSDWIGSVITRFAFAATQKDDAAYLSRVIDAMTRHDSGVAKKLLRAQAAVVAFSKANVAATLPLSAKG